MFYLYGVGAFNEVAFVAMLKAGMDTGPMVQSPPSVPASCSPASSRAPWWGSSTSAAPSRPESASSARPAAGAGIIYPVENFTASLITGMGIGMAIGYVIILARKFTINQSNSTYGQTS